MKTLTDVKETLRALTAEVSDDRSYEEFDSLDLTDFIMDVEDHYGIDLAHIDGESLSFDDFAEVVLKEINA